MSVDDVADLAPGGRAAAAGPPPRNVLMKPMEPIRKRKLYEDIVERIETAIHSGDYPPGHPLPAERELMETFGVGRTSVREALFALQRMGLVTINSGERARVAEPSAGAMVSELSGAARRLLAQPGGPAHFQQARALLEAGLARHAAEIAGPDDIKALKRVLDANHAAIDNPATFQKTDVEFHYTLARISRNPIFAALHVGLVEWLTEQREITLRIKGAAKAAYRCHKKIYDAIVAKDPAAAETAMRDHLNEVAEYYRKSERARF